MDIVGALGLEADQRQMEKGFWATIGFFAVCIFLEFVILPHIGETISKIPLIGRGYDRIMEETQMARIRFYALFSLSFAIGGIALKILAMIVSFLPLIARFPLIPGGAINLITYFTLDFYSVMFLVSAAPLLYQRLSSGMWKFWKPAWAPFWYAIIMGFFFDLIWFPISIISTL